MALPGPRVNVLLVAGFLSVLASVLVQLAGELPPGVRAPDRAPPVLGQVRRTRAAAAPVCTRRGAV